MGEEHFDLFAFGLGLGVEGRLGSQSGKVTRVLMFFAANEAGVCVWAAFWFRWARIAYSFGGAVSAPTGFGFFPAGVRIVSAGLQQVLAFRAGIAVIVFVPLKVGARECAILALRLVDQRDEGNDVALLCQPTVRLSSALTFSS